MKGTGTDYEGNEIVTQGYKAYTDARNDFEKVEQRRDLIWSGFLNDALDDTADTFDLREVPEALDESLSIEEQADAVMAAHLERYGYEPQRIDVITALDAPRRKRGQGGGFTETTWYELSVREFATGNAFEEEASRLANMLNGHSMQVVEAMSGWQQAGMFLGNAAVNIGSAMAMPN